jgi:hypothetical protein
MRPLSSHSARCVRKSAAEAKEPVEEQRVAVYAAERALAARQARRAREPGWSEMTFELRATQRDPFVVLTAPLYHPRNGQQRNVELGAASGGLRDLDALALNDVVALRVVGTGPAGEEVYAHSQSPRCANNVREPEGEHVLS